MPKISDERRAERRGQILEAAWRCFDSQGLQATTMRHIIAASGLSAGAVYSYFKDKDDLIAQAVEASLGGIAELVAPLLAAVPLPPPEALAEAVAVAVGDFSRREGFDLRRLALLGWAEAQRNPALAARMTGFYAGFRERLAGAARAWAADGRIAPDADPDAVAATLLSLLLGEVVQAALLGDGAAGRVGDGLRGLARPR